MAVIPPGGAACACSSRLANSGATSSAMDRRSARFLLSSKVSFTPSLFEPATRERRMGMFTPGMSARGGAMSPRPAAMGAPAPSARQPCDAAFLASESAARTASSTRISCR